MLAVTTPTTKTNAHADCRRNFRNNTRSGCEFSPRELQKEEESCSHCPRFLQPRREIGSSYLSNLCDKHDSESAYRDYIIQKKVMKLLHSTF